MGGDTIEERIQRLENTVHTVQELLAAQVQAPMPGKRGWRWFVGIYSDSPDFDEVVRVGQEWRNSDRPIDTSSDGVDAEAKN